MIDQPVPCIGIAEVKQSAFRTAQYPFRMLGRQPCPFRHAFRLEPNDNLHRLVVSIIANRTQTIRETMCPAVHFPCSRPRPAFLGRPNVPAGIHPPVVQFETFLKIAVDELFLTLFVGLGHLGKLVGAARVKHRQGKWLVAPSRNIMLYHPLSPEILCVDPVTVVPEQHGDHRSSDRLAGP